MLIVTIHPLQTTNDDRRTNGRQPCQRRLQHSYRASKNKI